MWPILFMYCQIAGVEDTVFNRYWLASHYHRTVMKPQQFDQDRGMRIVSRDIKALSIVRESRVHNVNKLCSAKPYCIVISLEHTWRNVHLPGVPGIDNIVVVVKPTVDQPQRSLRRQRQNARWTAAYFNILQTDVTHNERQRCFGTANFYTADCTQTTVYKR